MCWGLGELKSGDDGSGVPPGAERQEVVAGKLVMRGRPAIGLSLRAKLEVALVGSPGDSLMRAWVGRLALTFEFKLQRGR